MKCSLSSKNSPRNTVDFEAACSVYIRFRGVNGYVFRRQARRRLGAEDVPLAEKEAAGDLPRLTFGSSDPAAADGGG